MIKTAIYINNNVISQIETKIIWIFLNTQYFDLSNNNPPPPIMQPYTVIIVKNSIQFSSDMKYNFIRECCIT